MKIIDKNAPPQGFTLDDTKIGDVVRLKNGALYLITEYVANPTPAGFRSARESVKQLVNLETGSAWTIKNGHKSDCTKVDATLTIGG